MSEKVTLDKQEFISIILMEVRIQDTEIMAGKSHERIIEQAQHLIAKEIATRVLEKNGDFIAASIAAKLIKVIEII